MGSSTYGPVERYGESDWEKTISINLTGAFIGIKSTIPALKRAGGASIVNISSPAGLLDYTAFSAYFAATFGISSLTRAAALELARDGIRVNCVHPGLIGAPRFTDCLPGEERRFPRNADESAEVGRLVAFLASDESSLSTAQEFTLDGGRPAGAVGLDFGNLRTAA